MSSDSHYYQAPLNDPITYGSINICNRDTNHCSNIARIKSDKEKYGNLCQHSDSIGGLSAHNCVNGSGKSYLCVQCGVAHCFTAKQARQLGLEDGDASIDASGHIESHIVSASNPLSPVLLYQIANAGPLDEISNYPGSVRHHIYWHGNRNKSNNTLSHAMLFWIYQTTRHGPQNGFRLCVVHSGFHIASATKSEDDGEDDIDRLEKEIPQGHMEVVFLGSKPPDHSESEEE